MTQLDPCYASRVEAKDMIATLCKALPSKHRSQITARIIALEAFRLDELSNSDLSLSLRSLNDFISFMSAQPDLEYPTLTLSPSGFIYAEWENAPTQHFTVPQ